MGSAGAHCAPAAALAEQGLRRRPDARPCIAGRPEATRAPGGAGAAAKQDSPPSAAPDSSRCAARAIRQPRRRRLCRPPPLRPSAPRSSPAPASLSPSPPGCPPAQAQLLTCGSSAEATDSAMSAPGAPAAAPHDSSSAPGATAAAAMDAPPGGAHMSSGPRHCAALAGLERAPCCGWKHPERVQSTTACVRRVSCAPRHSRTRPSHEHPVVRFADEHGVLWQPLGAAAGALSHSSARQGAPCAVCMPAPGRALTGRTSSCGSGVRAPGLGGLPPATGAQASQTMASLSIASVTGGPLAPLPPAAAAALPAGLPAGRGQAQVCAGSTRARARHCASSGAWSVCRGSPSGGRHRPGGCCTPHSANRRCMRERPRRRKAQATAPGRATSGASARPAHTPLNARAGVRAKHSGPSRQAPLCARRLTGARRLRRGGLPVPRQRVHQAQLRAPRRHLRGAAPRRSPARAGLRVDGAGRPPVPPGPPWGDAGPSGAARAERTRATGSGGRADGGALHNSSAARSVRRRRRQGSARLHGHQVRGEARRQRALVGREPHDLGRVRQRGACAPGGRLRGVRQSAPVRMQALAAPSPRQAARPCGADGRRATPQAARVCSHARQPLSGQGRKAASRRLAACSSRAGGA
jgi:hypothetical protein